MPRRTSRTSAPTASHRLATAFTNDSLVARKALEAYLIVSAVAASVTIRGAWVAAKSAPTRAAAAWSSAPTTIRSGWRQSWTADPSRRNSGLETTGTPGPVEEALDEQGRAHRDRRLVHDHGPVGQMGTDLWGHATRGR